MSSSFLIYPCMTETYGRQRLFWWRSIFYWVLLQGHLLEWEDDGRRENCDFTSHKVRICSFKKSIFRIIQEIWEFESHQSPVGCWSCTGSEDRWWITTWKDVRGFLCIKLCLFFFFLALWVGLVIHYIELVFLKTVFAEVQHHITKTCNYFQYTLCFSFLSWDIEPFFNWKHRWVLGWITLKDY